GARDAIVVDGAPDPERRGARGRWRRQALLHPPREASRRLLASADRPAEGRRAQDDAERVRTAGLVEGAVEVGRAELRQRRGSEPGLRALDGGERAVGVAPRD